MTSDDKRWAVIALSGACVSGIVLLVLAAVRPKSCAVFRAKVFPLLLVMYIIGAAMNFVGLVAMPPVFSLRPVWDVILTIGVQSLLISGFLALSRT